MESQLLERVICSLNGKTGSKSKLPGEAKNFDEWHLIASGPTRQRLKRAHSLHYHPRLS